MILTRVVPSCQKMIYSFKLVVGHMTKQMKHGRSCDTEIRRPSVENVALEQRPRATFSTSGSSYFNVTLTTMHHLYNVKYKRCIAHSSLILKPFNQVFKWKWQSRKWAQNFRTANSNASCWLFSLSIPINKKSKQKIWDVIFAFILLCV